jgi:adenine phosphoribosyltransferase
MKNKFNPLFQWAGDKVEDVRFWCEPVLTAEAIQQISKLGFGQFDGIASFEARGFFLAGMAASQLKLPTVLIRKHKRFYDQMEHQRIDFTNWKHEPESLTILKKSLPSVTRALIVDDIFDTGNSLRAGAQLLEQLGIKIAGAFYLLNAGSPDSLEKFRFPIEAVLKKRLFT